MASDWVFPIHFTPAGLYVGELLHLLIKDVDLEGGCSFRPVPSRAGRTSGPTDGILPGSTQVYNRTQGLQ